MRRLLVPVGDWVPDFAAPHPGPLPKGARENGVFLLLACEERPVEVGQAGSLLLFLPGLPQFFLTHSLMR